MFKHSLKGFLAGIIITCLLFSIAFAAPVTKSVKAVFDSLNMQITGKSVKVDTIVYNNTLYAPVKSISEALGKDFKWNTKTNAVSISDKQPAQDAAQAGKPIIEFTNIVTKTSLGLTIVYGEATNNTIAPQTFTVKVLFYDKENKLMGTAVGLVNDINPGETKTFAAMATADFSGAAGNKVEAEAMAQSAGIKNNVITFAQPTINNSFGMATMDVDVKNTDTKAHSFTVFVSFYDANKKLIGVASGALNDLGAGVTKNLTAISTDDISKYKTFRIQINTMIK